MKASPHPTFRRAAVAACCWGAVAGLAVAQEGNAPSAGTPQKATAEALAAANLELDSLREELSRSRLQIEALGLSALSPEARAIQERLAKALGELSVTRRNLLSLSQSHEQLLETGAALVSSPAESSARAAFQQAMKRAGEARRKASEAAPASSLEAARVVSYKSDIALAVVSVGRLSGLRPGTPMVVTRGDQPIASGVVVDLRDNVAGVLITGTDQQAVRAGDSARPRTDSTISEQ